MKTLFFSLLSTLPIIALANTYKVAVYDWEPFVDSKQKSGGISIQILRKIMNDQGHNIELVSMPWARSLIMLEKNEVDILPAVWFTEKRATTMYYSNSYAANRLVFIKVKGDNYEFTGLSSLYDKTVGIVRNYAYEEDFLNNKNIQYSVVNSINRNVKKLIAGRIDLTLGDELAVRSSIAPSLLEKIEFTQNTLSENPLYITCKKSNPSCEFIIETFNRGIKKNNDKPQNQ